MADPATSADASGQVVSRASKNIGESPPGAGANEFAVRLRGCRKARGLTQEALARAAGVSAKFVSQIENGHTNPSIDVVMRLIEQGLGLPMPAFFAGELEDDERAEIAQLAAWLGGQPAEVRRRALKVLKALCED